jgi:two-component system NtrC family response regulator
LLIVGDDPGLLRQLQSAFSDHKVYAASTRQEATDIVRKDPVPVAIVDLGLPPDPDGASEVLAILADILAIAPATKVIIATGNETREYALQAIAAGAYDFYQKPIDIDVLQLIVTRAERIFDRETENRRLLEATAASPIDGIIATSPEMLGVLRNIEEIALTDLAVLLRGESGTGKELLARAVHKLSARAREPFVPINCAAIPETLLESELFGHEKGAFTAALKQTVGRIESADRGTLFLDEIGAMPLPIQVNLLRFLQNQIVERIGGRSPVRVDVRIVCATNQDLNLMMAEGRFREDLYHWLNEVTVQVPPLRERAGDAIALASFYLNRFAAEYSRPARGFSATALAALKNHPWQGNVRELMNRVKPAVVMTDGPLLSAADLGLAAAREPPSLSIRDARVRAEREAIRDLFAGRRRPPWGQGPPPAPAPIAPEPVRPKPRSGGAEAPLEFTEESSPDAVARRAASPGTTRDLGPAAPSGIPSLGLTTGQP